MAVTQRAPGMILTEREHVVPLDHAGAGRGHDHGLHPRGRGSRRRGPAVPALPAGRPGVRVRSAVGAAGRLGQARPRRLPAPAPRPARHGSVESRRRDPGRDAGGAGQVHDPLPRRFDRPRCGAHPAGARGRALEPARPELWRLLHHDVPVVRARAASRRRSSPAGCRRSADRSTTLSGDLCPDDRAEPRLLRALSR